MGFTHVARHCEPSGPVELEPAQQNVPVGQSCGREHWTAFAVVHVATSSQVAATPTPAAPRTAQQVCGATQLVGHKADGPTLSPPSAGPASRARLPLLPA